MPSRCPGCNRRFRRLDTHPRVSASCSDGVSAAPRFEFQSVRGCGLRRAQTLRCLVYRHPRDSWCSPQSCTPDSAASRRVYAGLRTEAKRSYTLAHPWRKPCSYGFAMATSSGILSKNCPPQGSGATGHAPHAGWHLW